MAELIKGLTEKEYMKQWRQNNLRKVRTYQVKDRWKRKEKKKQYDRMYYHEQKNIRKTERDRIRLDVLKHYSHGILECSLCGYDIIEALDIDHIYGGGNKHRENLFGKTESAGFGFYKWLKKNNYPDGFRVLCKNCNYLEYLKLKGKKLQYYITKNTKQKNSSVKMALQCIL